MRYLVFYIGLVVFPILYTQYFILNTPVQAVSMYSPDYKIESANVSDAAGNKSSTNYALSDTVGQTAAGSFSSSGYYILAGFQYLHSIIPFRFVISNTNINLGTLSAQTPSTANATLTIDYGGAGQYQVTAGENSSMALLSNPTTTIPDTSCDGGSNTCNTGTAKVWSSGTAYGFGYNMSGNDIPADFINSTYYRPFASISSPAVVMSSSTVGTNRQSTITYKVNVSNTQPAGSYQTIINFVATPSY